MDLTAQHSLPWKRRHSAGSESGKQKFFQTCQQFTVEYFKAPLITRIVMRQSNRDVQMRNFSESSSKWQQNMSQMHEWILLPRSPTLTDGCKPAREAGNAPTLPQVCNSSVRPPNGQTGSATSQLNWLQQPGSWQLLPTRIEHEITVLSIFFSCETIDYKSFTQMHIQLAV